MLSTSARLLRLASLLQARHHWPGRALAERLEIDPRTLRRDVDRLRELGYPVRASSGRGGGYSLDDGTRLPPLTLEENEAVTIALALRAAGATVGGLEAPARELLAKLDRWLPARLRRRASSLHEVTFSLDAPAELAGAGVLTTLVAACRDRQRLHFRYRTHDGTEAARCVEPARVVNYGRRWYLAAWDVERGDWRTFRADRITPPVDPGSRFTPRDPAFDAVEHVRRAVAWSPFEHRIVVRLRGRADELARSIPAWCGVLVPDGEETTLLHAGADTPENLVASLCTIGHPFEIVDAGRALEAMKAVAARLTAGLGTNPQ